ncbi:hypothetical protein KJ684_03305 [Patescibacteria group bacterium]|nr:hypothetical protein [Patescibacteria group bacterium]
MKKVFLSLFLVLLVFFSLNCSYDPEKEHTTNSATIMMLSTKTYIICGIETKMVMWKEKMYTSKKSFENAQQTRFWFLYPIEKIQDNLEGQTIKMSYRILRLKKPPIIYVTNIEIIN